MRNKRSFFQLFLKEKKMIGSISPSSNYLAEKMLEKSKLPGMFTGVGKLRPGKAALLALLAGGWGLGAGAIRHKYRQDDSDRTDAKAMLNALRTTVMPDPTSNTMQ